MWRKKVRMTIMQTRLNKFLAGKGIASRRKADDLIVDGKIKINGKVVKELGTKVSEEDKVEVDAEVLAAKEKLVYFALNKPLGFICSNSPTKIDKKIVVDLINCRERIFPVGRLDKDSSGLLVITNDGNLSFHLTHPKFKCEKEYEVEVAADLTAERVRKVEKGVSLERQKTQATQVMVLDTRRARIILREGKNRQVRKIFGKVGCEVTSLKRVRVKNLKLGRLKIGEWRELSKNEVENLKS